MSYTIKQRALSGLEGTGEFNYVVAEVDAAADFASLPTYQDGSIGYIKGDPDSLYMKLDGTWSLIPKSALGPGPHIELDGANPHTIMIANRLFARRAELQDVADTVDLHSTILNPDNLTYEAIQNLVRNGDAADVFSVGDQIVVPHSVLGPLAFDVIGFDQDTPVDTNYTHSMALQLHTPLAATRAFDAAEANYKIATQINNATQCVISLESATIASATYRFTAPSDMVVGGLLKIIDATHLGYYATETATVVSIVMEAGAEGDGYASIAASIGTQNHKDRVSYGSNRWSHSGLRQWLNSGAAAGSWWASKNDYDMPVSYAASVAGFLSGMDADFLAVVGNVTKRTALNSITDGATANTVDGDIGANDYEDLTETFFLPSRNEVNGVKENRIPEGEPYTYYLQNGAETADAVSWRIKYSAVPAAVYWWLRSPASSYASLVRFVYTTGQVGSSYAHSPGYSVAPACVII